MICSVLVEIIPHAIYNSSSPEDLGQEDFLRFPSLPLCEI